MNKKVFVSRNIPREGLAELFSRCEVDYNNSEIAPHREQLFERVTDVVGLINLGIRVDKELLSYAPKLKVISNYGAGYDQVDVDEATRRGIVVTNTPEAVTEATAEMAFGLIIAVTRRICEYDRLIRGKMRWRWGMSSTELTGKTLGIVGFGRIGQSVARRAKAFGMDVIYYQRRCRDKYKDEEEGCYYRPLDQLLAASDVVSLHVPLTEDTHHLIGTKQLSTMKKGSFLINTARGPVVDEDALVKALESGHLGGAGLDVFEKEPKVHEGLLKLENTVLTPHAGTHTFETRLRMTRAAATNLLEALEGKRPRHIVNPGVYDENPET